MAFYLLGECCAWLMNGFVPGSVLGMMFLFLALSMHWVRPERVRPVARFLCDNMAFFFLPALVGVMEYRDALQQYLVPLLVICVVSTLLTFAATALSIRAVLYLMERRKKHV